MAQKPNLSRSGGSFGSYVQISGPQMARLLASPQGPVVQHLLVVGERVKVGAKERVGVYRPPPAGPVRERRPGTLRDSIVKRLARGGPPPGVAVLVGSDDPIALIHHQGTPPHPIVARRATHLVFYSRKYGKVVYVRKVMHPGTRPNRYLTDALAAAVR